MSKALETALAQIAALHAETAACLAREAADTRLSYLQQQFEATRLPNPRDGFLGGLDVFAQITSPANFRHQRIKHLVFARKNQLSGYVAKAPLDRAAILRRDERWHIPAQVEASAINFIMGNLPRKQEVA